MGATPRAQYFAIVFCLLNAAANLGIAYGAYWGFGHTDWIIAKIDPEIPREMAEYQIAADTLRKSLVTLVMSGVLFAGLNVWLAFARRSSTIYHVHLGNFALGIMSCVCAPMAIPMIFIWLKPAVKQYYGVMTKERAVEKPPPYPRNEDEEGLGGGVER